MERPQETSRLKTTQLRPGMRVKIEQSIDRRGGKWSTEVVGQVRSMEPKTTGSWYAHAKNDRYWLLRIELEKDDGEISWLTVDQHTRITEASDGSTVGQSSKGG